MITFLIYILKVSILTAAFVLLYHLLFTNETFFKTGRAVLLFSLAASYILPLCIINIHRPATSVIDDTDEPAALLETDLSEKTKPATLIPVDRSITTIIQADSNMESNLPVLIFALYLTGMVVLVSWRILSILKIVRIIRFGKIVRTDTEYTLVISDEGISPFNWMRYIVLPATDEKDGSIQETVICHELAHIRHHHSADIIINDILSTLQWFNPAVWLLRRDLTDIHEFQADDDVVRSGIDKRNYQKQLFSIAAKKKNLAIVNSFGMSNLRTRVIMMNRAISKPWKLIKLAYIPVLTSIAIVLSSNTIYDRLNAPYVITSDYKTRLNNSYFESVEKADGYEFSIINSVAVLVGCDLQKDTLKPIPSSIVHEGKRYNVRVIAAGALQGALIRDLVIPEGITEIAESAFSLNSLIESVTIPSTVCVLEPKIFDKCINLKTVYIRDGLRSLPDGMFLDCRSLQSVHLPSTLTSIGEGAFSDCRNLKEINLPRKLEHIGNEAFFRCIRLSSLQIPRRVKYIGNGAFYDCLSLGTVNGDKLRARIGDKAFHIENKLY
ncbi:MAG: leucine-rich repeat protein [Ruminococcus sp.]|nr:leucine-rich repeat protein [Ruminococcus sp.]